MPFKVGAAKTKITPTPKMGPVYRAGYKMGEAEQLAGVVDDIFLRCLTIENETARVVFLSLDLIGLFRDFTETLASALAPRGIQPEQLIVATTHTHSAPDTMGLWGPSIDQSGYNDQYGEFLIKTSAETISEALAAAQPSEALFAYEECDLGVANHRVPDELSLALWLLSFKSTQGTVGSLISYTAQPELTPRHDDKISAGYPGEACRLLDEQIGGTTLFLLGVCGAMEPEGCEKGYAEAHAYGQRLAEKILELTRKSARVPTDKLTIMRKEVKLPVENPGFHLMMEAGVIRTSQKPPDVISTISRVRLGDLTMYALPGETFPGIVAGVGERGKTLFINQANDSLGYLIPPEQFRAEPAEWAEGHHFTGHELESLGRTAGKIIRQSLLQFAPA
ncbi:MAG: hypothetical protein C4532_11205 [Candidatus Abyssobacteria bacterium SURF_17]|uniref:Neutral/alkaline non-lysosomal ceramidase N-terminal domain-containing protein n=1 Tax=Candidatus Abyssobacteria bacterium SURF_17 TaxID=2093361 RepID=A0A419EWR1_9BACT|nr:MAG: hypothetical protein C4532_11205 [Candidatus Abyssubacteria bacterium SURF_17]